jgi:hypothetical protein
VSVSVIEQRNRAYNVLGGVARPNVYVITDEEFRLLDALTAAGDVQSPFIEEIFIFRKIDAAARARAARVGGAPAPSDGNVLPPATAPAEPTRTTEPADDLAPQSRSTACPAHAAIGAAPAGGRWQGPARARRSRRRRGACGHRH